MAQPFAESESSDETYFVSLNDMMIGLVFLFIIILMAFALSFRTAEQTAEQTLAELKKERDELEKERDKLKAQRDMLQALTTRLIDKDALRDALLLEIQGRLADRGVYVVVEREKGILRLPEDLLFASAEADLSPRGVEALAVLSQVLEQTLPCYAVAPGSDAGELRRASDPDPRDRAGGGPHRRRAAQGRALRGQLGFERRPRRQHIQGSHRSRRRSGSARERSVGSAARRRRL